MNNNQKHIPIASNLDELLEAKNLQSKAVDKLEECLEATNTIYDIKAKVLRKFPNFKTKLGAIQIILAYTASKPVERREIIPRHVTTLEELRAKAKASPELRRAISELLDEKTI